MSCWQVLNHYMGLQRPVAGAVGNQDWSVATWVNGAGDTGGVSSVEELGGVVRDLGIHWALPYMQPFHQATEPARLNAQACT